METKDKIIIGFSIIAAIFVIIIVWRVLGKVGLVESKESRQKKEAVENFQTSPYFDKDYYKNKSFKSLGAEPAKQYAKEIYNTHGVFNDSEDTLYSIFGNLKNKVNISEVAEQFYKLYGKDMKGYIANFLDDKEQAKLQTVISKLPNF